MYFETLFKFGASLGQIPAQPVQHVSGVAHTAESRDPLDEGVGGRRPDGKDGGAPGQDDPDRLPPARADERPAEGLREARAAGGGMLVHCVNAQGRTKADVALQLLAEAPAKSVVVMVDDDLRELVLDDRLLGGRVHRVFFSPRELG